MAEPRAARDFDVEYAHLRQTITRAGLLDRAYGYYALRILFTYAMFATALALPFVAPATFGWSVGAALLIGFASVQVSMVGHDAGHLAVFKSARANFGLGLISMSLSLGVGFWYWCDRHNRHHAHTNAVEDDPDLAGSGLIAFSEEEARTRRGWRRAIAKHQAKFSILFLIFQLILVFAFRIESWLFTLRRLRGSRRRFDLALLMINLVLSLVPAALLGWRWLYLFAAGQMIAGIYLGLIVATNHKGMPVWAKDAQIAFMERQILSSRNVTSNPLWDFIFGGLNYQIEHHLFPTMPRVNLRHARPHVKLFCVSHGLSYEEVDPLTSYRRAYLELRRIGRAVA
jgi:fatty acid desaturase